jgi:XTP/dITP diphosphohydrolase
MNNKPGIYSARLAKKHGSFLKAMKHILKKLKKEKNRKATFVCSLSYKSKNQKVISVEGRLKGNIATKILGKKGFGYDPIFIPQKKRITFGQMSKSKKIKIDHRYLAFRKLKKKIRI